MKELILCEGTHKLTTSTTDLPLRAIMSTLQDPLVPFLTGDTLLACLLVALLSLVASMTEAEQILGCFRRAIASVEEEEERRRQRQEPGYNGREADME